MNADILTLCESAQGGKDSVVSIIGATAYFHTNALPYVVPVRMLVTRLIFDDPDEGQKLLRMQITGTDGDVLHFKESYLDFGKPQRHPSEGEHHRSVALNLQFQLPVIEIRSYGLQEISISCQGEEPVRTHFYVYPEPAIEGA